MKTIKLKLPRKIFAAILIFILSFQITYADYDDDDLSALQEEIDNTISAAESLEDYAEELDLELNETARILIDVMASIEISEEEIESLEEQIWENEENIEELEEKKEQQYESIKKRIQYIYEQGNATYLEIFLKAASFSDLLTNVEYVQKLYEYDRKKLEEYQDTIEELEALSVELEENLAEEEVYKMESEEQREYLEEMIGDLEEENNDTLDKINDYYIYADELAEELKEKTDEIKAEAEAYIATHTLTADSNGYDGQDVVDYACQFIGNPYVWGGTSLTNGADCSGFVQSVYKHFGYYLSRTSYSQRYEGKEISSLEDALPGDLIVYSGHVAIYMGNGKIVHAASRSQGITTGNATYRTIVSIRRIIY